MFVLMNFQDFVSVLSPSCTLVPKAIMPQKIGKKIFKFQMKTVCVTHLLTQLSPHSCLEVYVVSHCLLQSSAKNQLGIGKMEVDCSCEVVFATLLKYNSCMLFNDGLSPFSH